MAALTAFGHDVGLAFQVADDVLDATGSSDGAGQDGGSRRHPGQVHLCEPAWGGGRQRRGGRLVEQAVARLQHTGFGGGTALGPRRLYYYENS